MNGRPGLALFDDNPSWHHQLIRLLAEVRDGGGDLFEILETASSIRARDSEDWFLKWSEVGKRNYAMGAREERRGNVATARDHFLRASNYFRMADFYLTVGEKRERATYARVVKSFLRAVEHFEHRFEPVKIPFGRAKMPGYFLGARANGRSPVVILLGGADSLKEEYYFRGAKQILERGMSCLLIDGPGQGGMLRHGHVYAPFDYEKPISSVVDHLTGRKDVDASRIALVASSLGGYFGVRAAAFEKRVAATVAWSAVYDVLKDIYEFFPPIQGRLRQILGAKSDAEARDLLRAFNLAGVVQRVRCPLLVVHGEEDYISSIQGAMKVYREAVCPKDLLVFKRGERGATHAQQDNLEDAKSFVFDWVKQRLG